MCDFKYMNKKNIQNFVIIYDLELLMFCRNDQ